METLDLFSQIENDLPATKGDKDLGCKWNFVQKPRGTMKRDREDSSFDPFKDNEVRCLVREYIQNSIDAAQKKDDNRSKKVLVTFSYGEMVCADYPNLIQSLIGRLKACSERSQQLPGSKDIYKSKYEFLNSRKNSTIGFLKVSDYYTTGMNYVDDDDVPSAFDSCVHCSSSSYKPDGGYAGGSHGLGKTVGFVNSPFNAVYYSTKDDESGQTFGEGVVRLCTHKYRNENGEKVLFEADAFYNKGGAPNSGDDIPVVFRREKSGTDAFVLGMEENAEDVKTMKKELLRGFFYAIYMELLDVDICGELFTKANIGDKMLEYFPEPDYTNIDIDRSNRPELNFNPRPYLFEIAMCSSDENHMRFTTDDFPGQFPTLGHATLQIWKSEDITAAKSLDKIIFMRNKLMTVEVRKYNSSKGFYGIMVCDGEGARYLRMLEDVRHDKWDVKELKDMSDEDKRNARKALRELDSFQKECIKVLFPEEHDKQLEIKSLKKRRIGKFGSRSEENEEDNIWPTTNVIEKEKNQSSKSGLFTIFEETKGRKKKKKKGTITDVEPETDPVPRQEPPTPPTPTPPTPTPPTPEPPKKAPTYVEGNEGEDDGIGETENPNVEREREIKLDGRNKRLKPLHNEDFACKLEIRVPKDYYDCRLVLDIQADEGLFPLDLKNVSAGYQIRSGVSNEIYGFDLKADTPNVIKFTPQENVTLYSLNIKVYGH
ncbi:hypothetical protein L6468_10475 [Prevotella communis]|uniref:hypothetical protein n=1 Tax=Prevotella communis TaxID=2913614 RepID=UPI001ED9E799|nr:hypothetical protein [Prevotella communis]UKK61408.1 hypothetical protein L6468_10475 [Prevotella communis]UKK64234.1 hypothetical protein L6473_10480 [Prevotella communis]